VEWVAVAGELGEELDVAGLYDARALRALPDLDLHQSDTACRARSVAARAGHVARWSFTTPQACIVE
jgi:hypothetical protein